MSIHDSGVEDASVESELTAEHRKIIGLIANGAENKEIAHTLGLSTSQVRNRIHQLMVIFDVRNRAHLVAKALRSGIVDPETVTSADERYSETPA